MRWNNSQTVGGVMKTFSDEYPQIARLRGEILFPYNIEKIEIEEPEGTKRTAYKYDLARIEDRGQSIDDREIFAKRHYAELRQQAYGSIEQQLEMMYEGAWQAFITAVRETFPKDIKKIR